MMKTFRLAIVLTITVSTVGLAQVQKPVGPKPDEPIRVQLPQAPVIRIPFVQVQRQPALIAWGDFDVVPSQSGPKDIQQYAAFQIQQMKQACKLTDKQVRTLEIAAKGVAYRIRQAATREAVTKKPPVMPMPVVRFRRGFAHVESRSVEFKAALNGHSLWKRTIERILTREQRKRWELTFAATSGRPQYPNAQLAPWVKPGKGR